PLTSALFPYTTLFRSDPGRQEVYTFNGRGQSATVFEAKSGKLVDTVPLPGKPEFAVVDTRVKRVYANIEDKNSVVVIDTKTHKRSEEHTSELQSRSDL